MGGKTPYSWGQAKKSPTFIPKAELNPVNQITCLCVLELEVGAWRWEVSREI